MGDYDGLSRIVLGYTNCMCGMRGFSIAVSKIMSWHDNRSNTAFLPKLIATVVSSAALVSYDPRRMASIPHQLSLLRLCV